MRRVTHPAACLVFLGTLVSTGCSLAGGDLMVRVKGEIPSPPGQSLPARRCELTAISETSGDSYGSLAVSRYFDTRIMVVVGRMPQPYHFAANCSDGATYRSRSVLVGARKSHREPFVLGTMELER